MVDYSVLDHARAATNHIATDWVDTATHRAGGYQAWIVVGSCSRGWAFDDAATTAAAACGAAAAIGAITAFAPATSAAAVTSTGGGTSSAQPQHLPVRPYLRGSPCHNCFVGGKGG